MTRKLPRVDLQTLVDSHDLPYVVIDRDMRVLAVNQAYRRSAKRRVEEAVGQHCYRLHHGHERPCYEYGEDCPHASVFADATRHSCSHRHRDADGEWRSVHVVGIPLRTPDGTLYMGESVTPQPSPDPARRLRVMEAREIARQLAACRGNRRLAARALGISERTLYRRLKQYRLT